MLAKLVIFAVDLTLALGIFVIIYTVCLTVTAGIFFSVLFYIFKGDTEKDCDFNKGRIGTLDCNNATGKPLAGRADRPFQNGSCPFPLAQGEWTFSSNE